MGKNFRGKGRRGGGAGRGAQANGGWRNYPAIVKEHKNLQRFYDTLLEFSDEEKEQYWDALRRELPNSFRFCGSKGHALNVKRLLQTRYIPEINKIELEDGRPVEPPKPVPWYPEDLAWWMTTPKNVIRRNPPFAAFQKFLVSETSIGNISRQEVVSMIPPLLMDVRPGHVVLDMCAAPGSKAAQLLEMLHFGEEARVRKVLRSIAQDDGLDLGKETQDEIEADLEADPSDSGRATGILIANDSDYKRGHMLVHQLKRLSSPNLLVTNHDATMFPSIQLPPQGGVNRYLKFDRILADVPCSGDGTLRKNCNLWKDWQPGSALGLHVTQIRILVRALQLLKVGGKVVYSTCSMNPVENEAVVSAAVERCGGLGNVDILDSSDKLPNLKRVAGMTSWKVMDKSGRIWDSWEAVEEFAKNQENGVIPGRLAQTMFPLPAGSDGHNLPLDRCMRVYPHQQDTGGFFITVLEKKKDFKAKNENDSKISTGESGVKEEPTSVKTDSTPAKPEPASTETAPAAAAAEEAVVASGSANPDDGAVNGGKRALASEDEERPAKKTKVEGDVATPVVAAPKEERPAEQPTKQRRNGPVEEVFKYLDPSHPVILNIQEFYRLASRFPNDRYLVRNEMGEPAKGIYYTSALIRDILTANEGRGVRFVHGGVRMFMKQDSPSAEVCRWRIQAEGMPIIQGYVGEPRVIHLRNKQTFHRLLIEMFPRINGDEWKAFDEIGEQVRDIGMGCSVLRIEPDGTDPDFSERMALPLWKSIHSLNLMLPKEDRSAMLLRIFNDKSPLINIGLKKDQPGAEKKAEPEDGAPDGEDAEQDEMAAVEDLPSPE